MGEAANTALTNALLEVSADYKRCTSALDRATLQLARIANASEDTNALALNEVRDAKLAMERAAAAAEKQTERLAKIETVLGIMREQTGAQKTEEATALKLWDRFAAASPSVRWAVVALAGAITAGGYLLALLKHLAGGH